VVVSNSLPLWLAMDQMTPPFPYPAGQTWLLYPSFLVPNDITPPYGVVHIYPENTEPMTLAPLVTSTGSVYQYAKDRVRVTLIGLRNFNAWDFIQYVAALAEQFDAPFGIMNTPIPRDEKRNQDELSALAMKKTMVYEINYYQSRMRDIAQQLILSVIPSFIVGA
jgi:hypothetical protein